MTIAPLLDSEEVKGMKKLYMYVTRDDYELPLIVADSAEELAQMLGTTKNTVLSCISHKRKGWARVSVEEGEE